jgi:hypothetical protein
MTNIGASGKRVATNISNVSGNEYNKNSQQVIGLSNNMTGLNVGQLAKSSKVIPKKEWRD